MKTKPVLSIAIVGIALLSTGNETAAAIAAPNSSAADALWSEDIDGLKARIALKRSQIVNGTPVISTYLLLRNTSDVMNPLSIAWRGELLKFHVADADGNKLPVAMGSYDGFELSGAGNLILPLRGELSFDYSSSGLGIVGDKAAVICLGHASSWVIEPGQKDYYLHAVLEVAKSVEPGDEWSRAWHGRIELPPVKIPVQPEPMDAATVTARINELGPKILDKDYRVAEEAERELSLIDDPGVIPWYVKALDTNSYGMKFRALDRLARFNSDEAFAALKKGLATRNSDFGDTASNSVVPTLVQNIRVLAVQGLVRSPHPDAKTFVLTLWDDRDASVQNAVLHLLGKMDTPESLELLKKMSADRDELVRGEANRYLKLREHDESETKPTD